MVMMMMMMMMNDKINAHARQKQVRWWVGG